MKEAIEAIGIALLVSIGLVSLALMVAVLIASGIGLVVATLVALAPALVFALLLEYRKQVRAVAKKERGQ